MNELFQKQLSDSHPLAVDESKSVETGVLNKPVLHSVRLWDETAPARYPRRGMTQGRGSGMNSVGAHLRPDTVKSPPVAC